MYYTDPTGNYSEMGYFFTYSKCGCCGCEFDVYLFLLELSVYVLILVCLYFGYKIIKKGLKK